MAEDQTDLHGVEEWFEDRVLYHIVGFLVSEGICWLKFGNSPTTAPRGNSNKGSAKKPSQRSLEDSFPTAQMRRKYGPA